MRKIIYFIILVFCFPKLGYAQNKYHNEWFNTDNLLPQNSVKDIIKCENGFIWVATQNGLFRFDGNTFVDYTPPQLKNRMLKSFFKMQLSKDSIYIDNAFEENLIYIHKRQTGIMHNLPRTWDKELFKGTLYQYIYKKDIWSGIDERINYFYNVKHGKYYVKNNEIIYCAKYPKTNKSIKLQIELKDLKNAFVLDDRFFLLNNNKICITNGNIINITTDFVFSKKNIRFYWNQYNNQVFLIDSDDIYQVSFYGNHLHAKKLLAYKDFDLEHFNSIYFDTYYNKLYFGSTTKGINVISFPNLKSIKSNLDKGGSIYYTLLPFSGNEIVSPHGIVYNHFGYKRNLNFKIRSDKRSMIYDNEYNIYTKQNNIIFKLLKVNNYQKVDSIVFKNEISSISRDGNLYFVCNIMTDYNSVLNVYRDADYSKLLYQFSFKTSISDIIKINEKELLVGSWEGLYIVNIKTKKLTRIHYKQNLYIRNFIRTKDGRIWILTNGQGFYLFNRDSLTKMPVDRNKFLFNANCLVEDDKGIFWITSNNGLFRVAKKQLIKYSETPKTHVVYYRYTTKDGLLTNEFNGGCTPCGNKLKNGLIVFPSIDGIVFFNPNKSKLYFPQNNAVIERANIDGINVHFTDSLTLDNDFFRADIFIDLPYYGNKDNIVIEAKLDDQPWENIKEDRKYSITHLNYGEYTLNVRILDANGYYYKKIQIFVKPFFYETIWFRIMFFSAIISVIFCLFRIRIKMLKSNNLKLEHIISTRTAELKENLARLQSTEKKLKKETSQQKKLIGTISHDITTPIKFLSILTRDLYEKFEDDKAIKKQNLKAIHESTLQLYNFTQTLKEYSEIYEHEQNAYESEYYDLHDLTESKKELFISVLQSKNINIKNNVNKNFQIKTNKKVLSVIIHNLLDNAVKNISVGQIEISAQYRDAKIVIEIIDTGFGMSNDKLIYYNSLQYNHDDNKLLLQKFGMGLHLVLQMISIIKGTLLFEANKPNGTKVSVILPFID